MKTLPLIITTLFLSLNVFANSEQSLWSQLKTKTIADGTYMETYLGAFKTLTHKVPEEPIGSYHVDYFSAVGAQDDEGQFQASHFEAVSEKWILLNDGGRLIDQWLYRLNHDGEYNYIAHNRIHKSIDGHIINYESLPFTDPEGQDSFTNYLERWRDFITN